ncbi:MAG: nucleotidyltransferase domain-containing protein, partial [Actinomycetales bacterium]|nr:nucleotidyltransferase domain-containing protein [Actinomycetales bacterium]
VRAAGASLDVTLNEAPVARGQLLSELRARAHDIREAARRHGIRNVRVFGSAARGEETSASDVDLLVDFDAAKHGILPLAGFASDVRAIIGREVEATVPELLRDEVRRRALTEAVPL